MKGMSSPLTAPEACSRISPYLSHGCLSVSELQLRISQEKTIAKNSNRRGVLKNIHALESRLWWHCHFIQKLESEPEMEFHNVNRGFDGMRENEFNQSYFEAWKKGETGYPLIDACMRSLIKTGWINFRMRAMLISFASFQLWLDWRKTSKHLGSLFTDFEPGIHFSQVQMQSGVTGINTIRIYSPSKQTLDQDPNGVFIKEYCPELAKCPEVDLVDPQSTPPMFMQMNDLQLGRDYPYPIVNHESAYREAKDKIFEWRQRPIVKEIARGVYQKHGSRKNNFFPTQHRKPFGNLDCKN